jgi:hypothetical protein
LDDVGLSRIRQLASDNPALARALQMPRGEIARPEEATAGFASSF